MAKEIGKLFTIQEANEKFGPVISATKLSVSEVSTLLSETTNYIMFKKVDEDVIVLNNDRIAIHPVGYQVQEQTVFTMYSTSIVNEMLSEEAVTEVSVEQRAEVMSITCGKLTLEAGSNCPPYCPMDSE